MADSEKKTFNHLSQKAYEELMDKSMKNVVKQTEKMTRVRSRAWLGEPKDIPSPKVEEVAVPKKKGGKK